MTRNQIRLLKHCVLTVGVVVFFTGITGHLDDPGGRHRVEHGDGHRRAVPRQQPLRPLSRGGTTLHNGFESNCQSARWRADPGNACARLSDETPTSWFNAFEVGRCHGDHVGAGSVPPQLDPCPLFHRVQGMLPRGFSSPQY